MSGIQTSTITTATDANLILDPDGTGELVLAHEVGNGETPIATDDTGKVHQLDTSALVSIPTPPTDGDWLMVQSGATQYKTSATSLGPPGASVTPGDCSSTPLFCGGDGSAANPFCITPITVNEPGGSGESVQLITITGQPPASTDSFTVLQGGARFAQVGLSFGANGSWTGRLVYNDLPDTTSGQTYTGILQIGTAHFSWEVTQIANQTVFSPLGSPNAAPLTVNFASDNKYGTVTGTYADLAGTLTATGASKFSVNGAPPTTAGSISVGNTLAISFDATQVAATPEGSTVSGQVTNNNGFLVAPSIIVNRSPSPFEFTDRADQPVGSVVASAVAEFRGINDTSFLTYTPGATTMTSPEASIAGGAWTAIPSSGTTMGVDPGQTVQVRAATGASAATGYTLALAMGESTQTWTCTTSAAIPAIAQPTILSPIDGAADIVPDLAAGLDITGSAYVGQNGAGAHTTSSWQLYEAALIPNSKTSAITSDDINPASATVWDSFTLSGITGMCWVSGANGMFFAAQQGGTTNYYSTDGSNWTQGTNSTYGATINNVVYAFNLWFRLTNGSNTLQFLESSPDGINWTFCQGWAASGGLLAAGGNKLVVSVYEGAGNTVSYVSTTGAASSFTTNSPKTPWNPDGIFAITYVDGTGKFYAVGGNGTIIESSNGLNWTLVTRSSTGASFTSCAASATEAIAADGAGAIWYMNPAGSWSQAVSYTNTQFGGCARGQDSWFAIGKDNSNNTLILRKSTNGSTWTVAPTANVSATNAEAITYTGTAWVMGANSGQFGTLETVTNQLTFATNANLNLYYGGEDIAQIAPYTPVTGAISTVTSQTGAWQAATAAEPNRWECVTYGGGRFVSLATNGTNRAMYSTDGISWTYDVGPAATLHCTSVTYGNGKFVGVSTTGTNQAVYSADGTNWTAGTSPNGYWEGVTYGNGKYVAVGQTGSIRAMYSTNGTTWTQHSGSVNGSNWMGLCYGGGKYVAVAQADGGGGANDRVMYSTDGVTWSQSGITGVPTADWYAVAYGNGKYAAVAFDGSVMYSSNGINWAAGNNTTAGGWMDLAFGNGVFVAPQITSTSTKGIYSEDGINWSPYNNASLGQWRGITYGGGKFVQTAYSGTNRVQWSETGTGLNTTELTFANNTELDNFRVGDAVTETNSSGYGTVNTVDVAGLTMILGSSGGSWVINDTLTGPTLNGVGNCTAAPNLTAKTMPYSLSSSRFAIGSELYQPYASGSGTPPPKPTTEPPSAGTYTLADQDIASTTQLTSWNVPHAEFTADKAYYARVKYADNAAVESAFSPWSDFSTADSIVTEPGDSYGGGFFVGQINDSGTIYDIIVAPDSGYSPLNSAQNLQGQIRNGAILWASSAVTPTNATSEIYGGTATVANGSSPTSFTLFQWCKENGNGPNNGTWDTTNSTNSGINGYNDWYIPALYELGLCYKYLKPTTAQNNTSQANSASPNAVPAYSAYTASDPAQTAATNFQDSSVPTSFTGPAGGGYYWTATYSGTPSDGQYVSFDDGTIGTRFGQNSTNARAIRRQPA